MPTLLFKMENKIYFYDMVAGIFLINVIELNFEDRINYYKKYIKPKLENELYLGFSPKKFIDSFKRIKESNNYNFKINSEVIEDIINTLEIDFLN